MFYKLTVLIDKRNEYFLVKIKKSYLKWNWVNNIWDDIRFIWLINFFDLRRLARNDKNDLWNWKFENNYSCRRSRNVNFNNIDSACSDWKILDKIIIEKNIYLKTFINFILLIIKLTTRIFFQIDAKRSE